jgi:carboxyl-terminal processing protease
VSTYLFIHPICIFSPLNLHFKIILIADICFNVSLKKANLFFMRLILFYLIFLFSYQAFSQPNDSLKIMLDHSILLMKQNALHKKEIDWGEFQQKVYRHTKGIDHLDSLLTKYPKIFEWLNDYHGGVSKNGGRWFKWREGAPQNIYNAKLETAINKGPYFEVERIDNYGYLRMPSVYAINDSSILVWTNRIADSICSIQPQTLKGWIIDLRLCPGGNLWPMIAALAPVLGDGNIGGITFNDDRAPINNFISKGVTYANNRSYSNPGRCAPPKEMLPVALLTGPFTASSGESLVIAFRNRKFAKVFGEPTAGYTTSNNSFQIYKNVMLFLATGYMSDGNGITYQGPVQPDVLIKDGDDFYHFKEDKKIDAAINWLKTQSKN